MTSVWTMFAKTPDETAPAITDSAADAATDDTGEALPAHVEEFLNLKAANAFF